MRPMRRFSRAPPRLNAKEFDGADLLVQCPECLLELIGRGLLDRGSPDPSRHGRGMSWRIVDGQSINEDQVGDHECGNGDLRGWMATASCEGCHRLARAPEVSPHAPALRRQSVARRFLAPPPGWKPD
jgi:hypothetical protein